MSTANLELVMLIVYSAIRIAGTVAVIYVIVRAPAEIVGWMKAILVGVAILAGLCFTIKYDSPSHLHQRDQTIPSHRDELIIAKEKS